MWESLGQVAASVVLGWIIMAIFLVRTEHTPRILLRRWLFLLVFGAAFGLGLGSVWVVILAFALPLFAVWQDQLGPAGTVLAHLLIGAVVGGLGAGLFRLVPISEGPLSGRRPSVPGWILLGALLAGLWHVLALALRGPLAG